MSSNDSVITVVAQESANFPGDVVMVHGQPCVKVFGGFVTYCATASLKVEKLHVRSISDSVSSP